MICTSNPLRILWVSIFIFASILAALGIPVWISVPSNPTYAEKGSQILLNWTFSYDAASTVWQKWYRATESGTQIGLLIMTKYQTEAVQINRPEYRGRLEFVSNGAILLKNVSLADEGYIAFGVDFADGQFLKQYFMLKVTIPPSVLLGLPNKTIALEGRPFSTQCIFESRPTPMIKWYMNGDPLVNGSRFHIDSQVIGTQNNLTSVRSILTINKVIVNDTGRVSCSAEIPFGTLSSTGSLIVQWVPAWISVPSNPTYAERGSQILLNWTFSYDASSTLWRKWYRATESGTQIGLTIMTKYQTEAVQINRPEYRGRLEFVSNGAILLKNVSLADEGYIAFGVDFADGQFLKQDIMLNVTIPPSVLLGLPNETIALEGRPFSTQCIFESRPTPMIKWYMNGDPLVNGSRFHIDSQVIGTQNNLTSVRSILTINKVIVNDTGRVSCSAEIPFGTLSSTGTLDVYYAPKEVRFTSNKATGIAILGEAIQFTCTAASLPLASYEIRHNSVLIMNSTDQVYKIVNVSLADKGTYTCVAYNYLGHSAMSSSNLTIYGANYSSVSRMNNSQTPTVHTQKVSRTTPATTSIIFNECNQAKSDEWQTRDSAFVAVIVILVIVIIIMSIVIALQKRRANSENHSKKCRQHGQGQAETHYMDLGVRSNEAATTYAQLQVEYEEIGQKNPQYVNA